MPRDGLRGRFSPRTYQLENHPEWDSGVPMYSLRSPEIPLSPPGRPEFPCGSPQGPDFDYRRGPLPPSPHPRYPDDQSLTTSLPPPCSGSFCLPVLPNTQLLHLRIQSRRGKRLSLIHISEPTRRTP